MKTWVIDAECPIAADQGAPHVVGGLIRVRLLVRAEPDSIVQLLSDRYTHSS